MTSLLKWFATNGINWDIEQNSALRTQSLKVKCQAFPHNGWPGLKWLTPASPPVTDNHHGAGVKGATGCGRWVQKFLGWHSRYLLCLDLLLWSLRLPNLYQTFGVLQEKQLLKDSPEHFFVAVMDKYFPTSFWWFLGVYSFIGKRYTH